MSRPGIMICELRHHVTQAIHAHAVEAHPAECCGLLVGRWHAGAAQVHHVHRVANVAERAQRHDRFEIDPRQYLQVDRQARRDGLDVVGVYHSHPHGPARPSAIDLAQGWPELVYLIAGMTDGAVNELTGWRMDTADPDAPRFEAVDVRIGDG